MTSPSWLYRVSYFPDFIPTLLGPHATQTRHVWTCQQLDHNIFIGHRTVFVVAAVNPIVRWPPQPLSVQFGTHLCQHKPRVCVCVRCAVPFVIVYSFCDYLRFSNVVGPSWKLPRWLKSASRLLNVLLGFLFVPGHALPRAGESMISRDAKKISFSLHFANRAPKASTVASWGFRTGLRTILKSRILQGRAAENDNILMISVLHESEIPTRNLCLAS